MDSSARIIRHAALVALVCLASVAIAPVAAATTFTDPQGRFSFTVPDGYTPLPDFVKPPVVAAYTASNPPGPNFTVQVREATGTLDATVIALQQEYVTSPGGTLNADGARALTLGGQPAQRYDFFTADGGARFHVAQVATIKGGALYLLTFTAQEAQYDTLISQTAGVLTSFSFSATPNQPAPAATSSATSTATPGTPPNVNGNVVSDTQGRFSFVLPNGWKSETPPRTTVAAFATARGPTGGLRATLLLSAIDVGSGVTLDAVTAAARRSIADRESGEFIADQVVTVGGIPARRIDYRAPQSSDGGRLRTTLYVAVKGTIAYLIFFDADQSYYNDYRPDFDALIGSMRFDGSAAPPSAPSAPSAPPVSGGPPPSNPPPAPTDPSRGARD